MAEPLLAFDELLQPIPGDDPAGESVPFALRAELEEARKEINPDDFDATDPLRPTEVKRADWPGVIRQVKKALTATSKDLLLAARLTEALTKQNGFAGLADGLVLMRRLVQECWDRLHPGIEDGDLEVRAGPFNWLGDDGRGAKFPYTLRTVPLLRGDGGESYTLRDWRQAQDGKGDVKLADIDKAINAGTREQLHDLVEDVTRAAAELTAVQGALNEKLGSHAPGMIDVRKVLEEALPLLSGALARKGGPIRPEGEAPAAEAPADAAGNGAASAAAPARAIVTREDVYHRLAELADLLERLEPHSPVPFLIRRAVELGSLPFPELMKALIREDYHQAITEMNRELGIKPPPEG